MHYSLPVILREAALGLHEVSGLLRYKHTIIELSALTRSIAVHTVYDTALGVYALRYGLYDYVDCRGVCEM